MNCPQSTVHAETSTSSSSIAVSGHYLLLYLFCFFSGLLYFTLFEFILPIKSFFKFLTFGWYWMELFLLHFLILVLTSSLLLFLGTSFLLSLCFFRLIFQIPTENIGTICYNRNCQGRNCSDPVLRVQFCFMNCPHASVAFISILFLHASTLNTKPLIYSKVLTNFLLLQLL